MNFAALGTSYVKANKCFLSHLHTDHTGLAGWIIQEWGCELWMSRSDFYMCKVMAADGPSDVPEDCGD